jgi:phage-related protein
LQGTPGQHDFRLQAGTTGAPESLPLGWSTSAGVLFTFSLTFDVREIRFYRTASGHSPVEEFLDSLSGKQTQKLVWVLRLVEELERVPEQYFKKLTGTEDLWEIRAQHGGDAFRILGFFDGPTVVVLVGGFAKKSRKTPAREIVRAEERKRDYLASKGANE